MDLGADFRHERKRLPRRQLLQSLPWPGAAALESSGCTLALDDVYDKVRFEAAVRLTLDEPR